MIYSYIQFKGLINRRKIKEMIAKIERVISTDPKMGFVRQVDARYTEAIEFATEAIEFAKENNVKIPMVK